MRARRVPADQAQVRKTRDRFLQARAAGLRTDDATAYALDLAGPGLPDDGPEDGAAKAQAHREAEAEAGTDPAEAGSALILDDCRFDAEARDIAAGEPTPELAVEAVQQMQKAELIDLLVMRGETVSSRATLAELRERVVATAVADL